MKNVALIGGSYDPIHKTHTDIAKSTFVSCDIDEVWIMPCNQSLWGKILTDSTHRLKMCELACQDYKYIKVSDWEIANNHSGKSYDLMKLLIDDYPDCKFSFIIGADNALKFNQFYKADALKELINIIVLPRSGYKVNDDDWFTKEPHRYLSHIYPSPTSSTEFKQLLKDNHTKAKELVDSRVYDYIIRHNLYTTPGKQQ